MIIWRKMSCYYINQVWYFFKHNTWYIKLNPNFSYFLTAIKILISDSKLHVNWQFTSHHICTTNKFFDRTYFCFLVIILGYVHVSKGIITNSNRTLLWFSGKEIGLSSSTWNVINLHASIHHLLLYNFFIHW